jgi:hypothetical protein
LLIVMLIVAVEETLTWEGVNTAEQFIRESAVNKEKFLEFVGEDVLELLTR